MKTKNSESSKNAGPEVTKTENKVNLLEIADSETAEPSLEVIRLGHDEVALIPFTAESVSVDVHFCPEPEINSYVLCNGPDCVLCKIGRKQDQRLLLPVYQPTAGCVGILPVSRSFRPFALLPQILNILKNGKAMVMFVIRDGAKYSVSTAELKDDEDAGETVTKKFVEEYNSGLHNLASVYPTIENAQLARIGEIRRMLTLKGFS